MEDLQTLYEELLLKRDLIYREGKDIEMAYLKEFGEDKIALYELQVECIKQKKAIAYVQKRINRGESVNPNSLQDYLEEHMKVYYDNLAEMTLAKHGADNSANVSMIEVIRAKKVYRRIAKMLHPDMFPDVVYYPDLMNLWARVVTAYENSRGALLEELEVLAQKMIKDLGFEFTPVEVDNLEEKIEKIEEEIARTLEEEPYTYHRLLGDPEVVKALHDDLKKEREEYTAYLGELNKTLEALLVK